MVRLKYAKSMRTGNRGGCWDLLGVGEEVEVGEERLQKEKVTVRVHRVALTGLVAKRLLPAFNISRRPYLKRTLDGCRVTENTKCNGFSFFVAVVDSTELQKQPPILSPTRSERLPWLCPRGAQKPRGHIGGRIQIQLPWLISDSSPSLPV